MIEGMNLSLVLPNRNFVWALLVLWKSVSEGHQDKGCLLLSPSSNYHLPLYSSTLGALSLDGEGEGGSCRVDLPTVVRAASSMSQQVTRTIYA